MPLLTRLLSPDAYGSAAMAGTMISLIAVVALSGMDMSYARTYYAKGPPSNEAVESFAWRYVLGSSFAAAVVCAIAWWFIIADTFNQPKYLAYLLALGIVLSAVNAMAQTRARLINHYRRMSLSIVVAAVGAAGVSIGVAIWWRQDELPLILSMVVSYFIPVLLLGIPTHGVFRSTSSLNAVQRVNVVKIGLAGIVTAPTYWVISSLDRWFLGFFEDTASVGVYSIGYSVAIMGMMVNNALTSVWLPEAAKAYESNPDEARIQLGNLAERLVAVLGVVWLAVTAAGGDAIRFLADPRFHEAAALVPYISGAVFFHGILHLANAGMLLKKKLHITMWWWLSGAVLCIILNLILLPLFGKVGAAITQTCSFALVAAGIAFSSQKLFPFKLRVKRLVLVILSMILFGAAMHPAWVSTPLYSLLIKFPLGLIIALLVFKFIAPDALLEIAHRVRRPKITYGKS